MEPGQPQAELGFIYFSPLPGTSLPQSSVEKAREFCSVVNSADEHLKQILRDEAGRGDVFIPLGKSSCQGHSSSRTAP